MPETELTTVQKHSVVIVSIAIMIIGLLCIIFLKDVWSIIGSCIFGSSLGTFFGYLASQDIPIRIVMLNNAIKLLNESSKDEMRTLRSDIIEELQSVIKFPISTDEHILKKHRVELHMYYITRKDDNKIWMYFPLDFSQNYIEGRLHTKVSFSMDNENDTYEYSVDGFIVGTNLALVVKRVGGDEKIAFCVYPDYTTGLHRSDGYWGVQLHSDFDKKDDVSPCIIFFSSMYSTDPGKLSDNNACDKLLKLWKKHSPLINIPTETE
jgi:hypothetical protein